MRQTINQTNSCRHLIIKRGNNLHAAFIWAIVHVFWHRCPFYGLKGGLHWLNDDGWWGGLVWWACWMVPWKDRQIHQQCSCPISGQGVLICSETSIHSLHQHYFLTSHTPTAPHQCLGQVEKIEKGWFYFTPGWTLCSGHRIKLLTCLPLFIGLSEEIYSGVWKCLGKVLYNKIKQE